MTQDPREQREVFKCDLNNNFEGRNFQGEGNGKISFRRKLPAFATNSQSEPVAPQSHMQI